ncbi:zinc finger, CCHC-type containing protein [Tanacetum coccineum]
MDVKTLRLDLKYILKLHLRLIDRRCEYTLLKLFHAILQRATSAESSSRLSISWSRTSGSLSMETMKDGARGYEHKKKEKSDYNRHLSRRRKPPDEKRRSRRPHRDELHKGEDLQTNKRGGHKRKGAPGFLNPTRHHYDDQGGGRNIPPHSRNRDDNRQHGKEESFSQDYNEEMRKPRDFSKVKCYNCNEYGHYASHCRKRDQRQQRREASNLVEEDLEPTLLMASTSFNKTQRKSSKDTPTNKSIWFAKDYDHEDSKFGEIILEEDEGGHDQDYDKLSMEDQQVEENKGRKPKVKTHFWSTIISKVVQRILYPFISYK